MMIQIFEEKDLEQVKDESLKELANNSLTYYFSAGFNSLKDLGVRLYIIENKEDYLSNLDIRRAEYIESTEDAISATFLEQELDESHIYIFKKEWVEDLESISHLEEN
jgi:hypothetical protein